MSTQTAAVAAAANSAAVLSLAETVESMLVLQMKLVLILLTTSNLHPHFW
jgi:hypothetical protein